MIESKTSTLPTIVQVHAVTTSEDLEAVRALLQEYTGYLATFISAGHLSFEYRFAEIAALPGDAVPPLGVILLARVDDEPAGCIVIGPMKLNSGSPAAELRRMFVRPALRDCGLGRRLVATAIDFARAAGHAALYLENDPNTMAAAAHLYRSFGFVQSEPQSNDHTLRHATFFRLELST